jgi:hypothetical protein
VATKAKVIPYVDDTRNLLVLRLHEPVPVELATTLRYALERGIEAAFQLEDSELCDVFWCSEVTSSAIRSNYRN